MSKNPIHERLNRAVTIALAVCACLVLLEVGRRELAPDSTTTSRTETRPPQFLQDWERLADGGNLTGPQDAVVKVVEFADFQCPFCAAVRGEIERIRASNSDRVASVFRHFPLDVFEHSFSAAMAAECAARQSRFDVYRNLLFANQERIGTTSWDGFAEEAGIPNLVAFRRCVADDSTRARVEEDLRMGTEVGVRTTPTIIVNGRAFFGADAVEEIERHVDRILAGDGEVASFE